MYMTFIVTLSESDITNIEAAKHVLEPMKTITTILCSAHTPTVSLILPFKKQIMISMEPKPEDSELIKDMKLAITTDLNKRYFIL